MSSSALADRLGTAARLKEEGNAKLLAKDYHGAVTTYKKVFLYTRGLEAAQSQMGTYATALGREMPTPEQQAEVTSTCTFSVLVVRAAGGAGLVVWQRTGQDKSVCRSLGSPSPCAPTSPWRT